jgi:trans-AT polyketide synthase/acyltransferase/oxidoreductase domain-containing protein
LTAPVVRYRVTGLKRLADGRVYAPNQIIAKASRIEVATRWFSPPPESLLKDLVAEGGITAQEAELAQFIPMAQDMTAEADSGGHTDNRAAVTLIPTLIALRDRMQAEHGYDVPLRVGAAGGIATPASAAAALAMGAAYIVTGSVNQACVESGSSDEVRKMLAETEQADVTMAPAADMFEMGVKLQVLKRGTMFAIRAGKLYELYRAYEGLDQLPDQQRRFLEEKIFRASLDEIWQQTRQFFLERDPGQVDRAMTDAKHKMALVFRWYLGMSSTWANQGVSERKIDYQVWCGSAMGAFNEWVKATFLEAPENRRAVTVAMNILYGTAVMKRIDAARWQGMDLPAQAIRVAPSTLEQLEEYIR